MATPQEAQAPKRNVVVLTNENKEEHFDTVLGTNIAGKNAPAEEPKGEDGVDGAQAQDTLKADDTPDDETEQEAGKHPKLQARFSELTQARKAAEAKAAERETALKTERDARESAERLAAELRAKYEPVKEEILGPKPDPKDYDDVGTFAKDLEEWKEAETRGKARKEAEEKATAERQQQMARDWEKRQADVRKELTDYDEKISGSAVRVSDQVRDAILESEVGPQILYHLAGNPEVAEKIGQMTVSGALRAIGKLEATLGEPEQKQTPTKAVAEISKAPAPITPIRNASTPAGTHLVDADGNFKGNYKQFKELRAKGVIK